MSRVCEIDTKGVEAILGNLSESNRKEAIFKSLVEGGKQLVQETKKELRNKLPNGATSGKRYGTPMESGIKLTKDKDYGEVKVHIMGDYRLRFFEMGTEERYVKTKRSNTDGGDKFRKSGYRGRIKKKEFFKTARDNSSAIINNIIQSLSKEINKLIR